MISDAQFTAWLQADGVAREVLVEVGCNHAGVEITRYLSRYGYHTNGTEAPAHQPYRAALKGGMSFSRKVGITSAEPAVSISSGDISLDNIDGRLDGWLGDVWTKRPLRVFIGDPSWPRADFRPIFSGRCAGLKPLSRTELALSAYDELQRLNFPVTEEKLGGTTDNKDALKHLAFGECFNVSPLLINPGQHEYLVNAGPVEAIIEVRDCGAPISITPALASGTFKLNTSPIGQISCDVQGAKVGKANGGAWLYSLASIIKELTTRYGDDTLRLADTEIDAAAFAAFDAANPAPLGLYLADKTNVLDACNSLAKSLSASLFFTRASLLRLWRMPTSAEVATTTPALKFGAGDMEAGSFHVVEIIPAQPAVKLGWGRNWTPSASGLAGGLPENSMAEFKKEFEEKTNSDAAAVALHRYTDSPTVEETLLVREADATTEAAARIDLRKQRKIVEFKGFAVGYRLDLGSVISVSHPRLNDDAWHSAVVIGLDDDLAANRVTIEALIMEAV